MKEYTGIEISASYLSGLKTETTGLPKSQLISLDVCISVIIIIFIEVK